MYRLLFTICLIALCYSTKGQSIQFHFSDSTFLPAKPKGLLHGISPIEYDSQKGFWHLGNDRGAYFVFQNIKTIRDFANLNNLLVDKYTRYWFESIRFDPTNGRFIFAVENEFEPNWNNPDTTTYVAWYDHYLPKAYAPHYLIAPMALPVDNKGIEAVAVTPAGNIWVAPEVGWLPEEQIQNDSIQFYKFMKSGESTYSKEIYQYKIDKSGCPYSPTSERLGGISEILSISENRLLVLERCYDNGPGGSKKTIAKLWCAEVVGNELIKAQSPAFDFNKDLPFDPDNLEGMAWWPTGAGNKKLVLVSDDNPGAANGQRTQIILLEQLP